MIRRFIKINKLYLILSRFIKLFIKEGFYNELMSRYNNVTEVYNIIYKGGYD